MTALTGAENLAEMVSITYVEVLRVIASLKDVLKIWAETPFAHICTIGIETPLVRVGGFGTSFAGSHFGAAASLVGVWTSEPGHLSEIPGVSPAAWHVIDIDGSTFSIMQQHNGKACIALNELAHVVYPRPHPLRCHQPSRYLAL